jgi:radical SAM superfamily enzyme YgiQ (UPF0313 family)
LQIEQPQIRRSTFRSATRNLKSAICNLKSASEIMNILLISTYELGRQPFGLASPAAWLRQAGHHVVQQDLAQEKLNEEAVRGADLIALYLPMHTATRIALRVSDRARHLNPRARLCAYGLYAPLNADVLREHGVGTVLGGEFEEGLLALVNGGDPPAISMARQRFRVPDRSGLPELSRYARLQLPDGARRVVGYTEATRGCLHRCRHCPIVPVYDGAFRVVQRDVVLADIRNQVAAGAEHITFGDPDFFNGVRHSLEIVTALHREFPQVSYDVTIKVEHLLRHAAQLATLRDTGCAFVTTAVESVDDDVLRLLDKGHTRADFVRVVELMREIGLPLSPTFIPFTPWTTIESYNELLEAIVALDLIGSVAPVQLAIRLLIPAGSRLLEIRELRERIGGFDREKLSYKWTSEDPRIDELQREVERIAQDGALAGDTREETFARIYAAAQRALGSRDSGEPLRRFAPLVSRAAIPYLTEPWYC